ncbi:MAG: extracellular solute-binding protein [Dehalococcoidia bacterium]|nr:extracellular solute-binding protein [Dehalococcoidia bacterium]
MKRHWNIFVLIAAMVIVLSSAACSPTSTPAPTPKPTTIPQTTGPATATPALSEQDKALAQLVETARKEGKVTAYAFSFTGDIGLALQRGFKDRYNIPMDIVTGRGAEMSERIKTERRIGNVVGDFMETSPTNVMNLKAAGATVSSADIPVLQEKDVWKVDPFVNDKEGHLLGHRGMGFNPYINTNLVKPGEEPKSYKDLLNPKWEGKMVISDPNVSSGSYEFFITLNEYKVLDMDTIKAIGLKLKFVAGTRQIAEGLTRGEYAIGFPVSDVDSYPFVKEGAPIKAIPMQEGNIVITSAMARVKDGPHPNATKLFINWMFTKEGQSIYTKAAGLGSVRKDVEDARLPNQRVEATLLPIDSNLSDKLAQLFRDKYLVNLWKK